MSNQTTTVKASKSNFGSKGWFVIIFSFLCILLQSSLINDSLNVVIEPFAQTRGWSTNSLYAFSSICSAISVLGAAFWGFVTNKTNIRFAWGISLAITAVACFFWGSAQSSTIYFVCLAVSTVCGMAFCYIANMNVISNWFPKKKGIAMGWVTIGFPLSASITTPLMSGILESGGLERVYTTYAIVAAIFAVIAFIFVRDYPEQAGCYPDNDKSYSKDEADKALAEGLAYMKSSPWKPGKLFKTVTVWKMAISLGVLELLSLGIMTNFMPRFLQAGYEKSEITVMLAVAGILACFGSYACGRLDAHFGSKKAILITQVIAIAAIILNLIPTRATQYASLPFLAMMLGGASNYLVSLANTIWGRYDFPMAYKVLKPMVALVGACGVAITGIIGQSFSYTIAYGVLGVLAVIALVIMMATPDAYIGRSEDDVDKAA